MEEIVLNIAINRRTKELVGYWSSEDYPIGIIVKAYAVDDLQRKFEEAKTEYLQMRETMKESYERIIRK